MSQTPTAREQAIHLLRAGQSTRTVAQALSRSESWVRRCRQRYEEAGWAGLAERSRAPHQHGTQLPDHVRTGIVQARSAREVAAARETGLKYIGARAMRWGDASVRHWPVCPDGLAGRHRIGLFPGTPSAE